ncbi:hypothetical protein MRB53_029933 [Persea americana]|uniref:Uncharacterized protein n=1 Tax=Persea americana TaxID=3435 RepID=A0ACC2KKA6_PERAE|nr:hypothetical protein MRB53_029933 [Persea americana]
MFTIEAQMVGLVHVNVALLLRSPKPIHFNCQFRNVVMISFKQFLFCRLQRPDRHDFLQCIRRFLFR